MPQEMTLPIFVPSIKTFLFHAYPLAVMENHPDFENWFYTNYIQLYYQIGSAHKLNFYGLNLTLGVWDYYPLLDVEYISQEMLREMRADIVELVRWVIQNGGYVYVFLDEYYTEHRYAFQMEHRTHDFLLYGYDDSHQHFLTVGFDENQRYTSTHIPYEALQNAFASVTEKRFMIILRVNKEKRFALDFENIREMVSDYLQSEDTSRRFKMYGNAKPDMVYGLAAYRELQTYIEQIKKDEEFLDMRVFTLLCEHKTVMAKRIRYLQKENAIQCSGEILVKFDEIVERATCIKNLMLKYSLIKQPRDLATVQTHLLAMREDEERVLRTVFHKTGD